MIQVIEMLNVVVVLLNVNMLTNSFILFNKINSASLVLKAVWIIGREIPVYK